MQTLTYGRQKPDDGDKGTVFFDALENNSVLNDAHTHNGTDSAKITASSVTVVTQAIVSAGWAASGSGFRQLVTCPGTIQYDTHEIGVRITSNGRKIMPTIEKVTATTFYVYCNDNTLDLTIVYS